MEAQSPEQSGSDVTRLLQDWRNGEPGALERLTSLVYDELHLIAARQMSREWRVSMYQTTALVSEAYLKLDGPATRRLAEPRPLLRDRRATDATDSR